MDRLWLDLGYERFASSLALFIHNHDHLAHTQTLPLTLKGFPYILLYPTNDSLIRAIHDDMPAERKTSLKTKSSRTLRTRDSNRKVDLTANDDEVIVLSDSEDDNTLLARARRSRKRQTPALSKTSAESTLVAKLRQEIEGLKKVSLACVAQEWHVSQSVLSG